MTGEETWTGMHKRDRVMTKKDTRVRMIKKGQSDDRERDTC